MWLRMAELLGSADNNHHLSYLHWLCTMHDWLGYLHDQPARMSYYDACHDSYRYMSQPRGEAANIWYKIGRWFGGRLRKRGDWVGGEFTVAKAVGFALQNSSGSMSSLWNDGFLTLKPLDSCSNVWSGSLPSSFLNTQ